MEGVWRNAGHETFLSLKGGSHPPLPLWPVVVGRPFSPVPLPGPDVSAVDGPRDGVRVPLRFLRRPLLGAVVLRRQRDVRTGSVLLLLHGSNLSSIGTHRKRIARGADYSCGTYVRSSCIHAGLHIVQMMPTKLWGWTASALDPSGIGNWSQILPSRSRPVFFLFTPPHCLKWKATPVWMH